MTNPGSVANAEPAEGGDIVYPSAIPFVLVHLTCIAAIWTGITWQAVVVGVGLYWMRIFAIGAVVGGEASAPSFAL